MRVADFDFELPAERIALRPVSPRDASRLLVVTPDGLADKLFADLPSLLRAGDLLVFNDTRVLPAQLAGMKFNAKIRVTLHKRVEPRRWWSFVKNAKRLKPGDRVDFGAGLTGVAEVRDHDEEVPVKRGFRDDHRRRELLLGIFGDFSERRFGRADDVECREIDRRIGQRQRYRDHQHGRHQPPQRPSFDPPQQQIEQRGQPDAEQRHHGAPAEHAEFAGAFVKHRGAHGVDDEIKRPEADDRH